MSKMAVMCKLVSKKELRKDLFEFVLQNKDLTENIKAGQFLHVKCSKNLLLRRPISIADNNNDLIKIIFEVKGKGTKELSGFKEGDFIDVLGPLGHGFTELPKNNKILLVGGGIGIFPLLKIAHTFGKNATCILGFKSKEYVVLENEFKEFGCNVIITTDDGSCGEACYTTDILEREAKDIDAIFACGPKIMLKKTAEFANSKNIFCEISMEEKMACGVGACLGCACKTKVEGEEKYKHVCKEGPVFNSKEVCFDD